VTYVIIKLDNIFRLIMGKKGIEIVAAKIDVNEVIADLNKAYADEWCAHYQYWLTAHWVSGINADAVSSRLTEQSADELVHAERFANRIIELGGEPEMDFAIAQTSNISPDGEGEYKDGERKEGKSCPFKDKKNASVNTDLNI